MEVGITEHIPSKRTSLQKFYISARLPCALTPKQWTPGFSPFEKKWPGNEANTEVTVHTLNHGISRVHKHHHACSVTHIILVVNISLGLQQHSNNSTVTILTGHVQC